MSISKRKESKYYKSSGKKRNTETLTGLMFSLIFGFISYKSLKSGHTVPVFIFAVFLLISLFLLLHGLIQISNEVIKKSVINKLIDDDNYILADYDHGGVVKSLHVFSGSEKFKYYFKYRNSDGKTYVFSSEIYSHPKNFGKQAKVYVDWTRPGKVYWVSDYKIK